MITRVTRKALSDRLGFADTGAAIPEARWMRAMTFESLVQSERFVSELLTKVVGQLDLPRPGGVRRRSGKVSVSTTATELAQAHLKAVHADEATMLTALAVPYLDLESHERATQVKPDFAVVAPRWADGKVVGSWLVMGDAKDYERVRSRIDDGRMLKGFLQVALGAESAAGWSKLPTGMVVHDSGALAVPRNSFLQPEPVVELLHDHRREVRARAEERLQVIADLGDDRPTEDELPSYVADIEAVFDPSSCGTCNLFRYCRNELRTSPDPAAVLAEIGIDRLVRSAVLGLVDGSGELGQAAAGTIAQVEATVTGLPRWTGRRRTDPIGEPGSINVVIAKSDAAALGVYGMALQRIDAAEVRTWQTRVFAQPQAPATRLAIMRMLGTALREALEADEVPLHLVVPDKPTADVLISVADSLAGVELSRLRWQRDVEAGRTPLTFDGDEATVPDPLSEDARLAVSFLLEEDRARAMSLRQPVVNLRSVLASHVIAGGPTADSGRLDYLLLWAEATDPLDHRVVSDEIATELHTPGARLSNTESDLIHAAQRGPEPAEEGYGRLVRSALSYKTNVVDRVLTVLATQDVSALRGVHRALEMDAQTVWRRRLTLEASDLVRFSRTYRTWRNAQVEMLDTDSRCRSQLAAMGDGQVALDMATNAGTREVAKAWVVATGPTRLQVSSRRLVDGSAVVALHVNGDAVVEAVATTVKIQTTSFKFGQMPIGPLVSDGQGTFIWSPTAAPALQVGDELIVADASWFASVLKSGHQVTVRRPGVDNRAAPKASCTPSSYAMDPAEHRWCCRPHAAVEAEWSDELAARRARGELNPRAWPPLIDEDRFDVGDGSEVQIAVETTPPASLTLDDVE